MKKVLLIDASFAAMPIYDYLTSIGMEVWVMGNRATDALALRSGSRWINQDYSQIDAVKEYIERLKINYIVPGCTDVSIETCLALDVNPHLFENIDTYKALGNKQDFRQLCEELNLPSPRVVDPESFPREGKYICKPVDAFSGRGVTIFDGQEQVAAADALNIAKKESASSSAIIETYIAGQLYSFSSFIEDQKIVSSFIVREGSSANPFAVDTSHLDNSLGSKVVDELTRSIESIAANLKLKDGLVHLQFILDGDQPYMIEIARRCPGDLYSLLIEFSTGYNYAGKYASYFIEQNCVAKKTEESYVLRHTVSSDDEVSYNGLKLQTPIEIKAFYPLLSLGSKVLPRQKTRVGILFCSANTSEDLMACYERFMRRTACKVD